MKGRKPVPPHLRITQSSRPRRGDPLPDAPEVLTAAARAEWDRLLAAFGPTGLLTSTDRAVLACYCETWADWLEARAELENPRHNKARVRDAWRARAERAGKLLIRLAGELGFSPVARTRLPARKSEADDALGQYLRVASTTKGPR